MPNDYTLYIDESGDFGSVQPGETPSRKPWILSGVLCAASPQNARTALIAATDPLEAKFREEYPNCDKFFHLWELRQFLVSQEGEAGYDHTVSLSKAVLDRVAKLPFVVRYFTINNIRKIEGKGHQDCNYLMMLPELIAQVDASLHVDKKPDSLTVYVAKRMKMNDRDDIDYSFEEIKQSVTMGLASRGLAELLVESKREGQRLTIMHETAYKHRGCQIADYVANSVSNAGALQTRVLVEELTRNGKLTQFLAFGSYLERKARILERDGDFAGALRAWMAVETSELDGLSECLERAVERSGDYLRSIIDSIIEQVWQEYRFSRNYAELYPQLVRFERAFTRYVKEPDKRASGCLPALFRFRTYQLGISNHLGNAPGYEELVERQEEARKRLDITPENFPLVLHYDITYMVTLENALQYGEMVERSARYLEVIRHYAICWDMLQEEVTHAPVTMNLFLQSRLYIVAETSYLGRQILTHGLELPDKPDHLPLVQLPLEEIIERLNQLYLKEDVRADDRGRVRNHLIRAYIKHGDYQEALALSETVHAEPLDLFHLFTATRATTDALLAKTEGAQEVALRMLKLLHQPQTKQSLSNLMHPSELIFREWGMLEYLTSGSKKAALHSLQKSRKGHLHPSPIYRFLSCLLKLHQDFIEGKEVARFETYFQPEARVPRHLIEHIDCSAQEQTTLALLRTARRTSPY